MKNLIILILFLPCRLFAQDLSGVWTGTLYNDSTQTTTKYEIAVSEKNGKLSAYSYAVFEVDNKEVYGVKSLEVIQSKGKTFFRDRDLLVDNYPADAPKGVKQISSIRVFDSLGGQYMTGTFTTTRSGKYGRPVTGKIILVKEKNNLRDIALIKHIIKQGIAPALDFVTAENTDKRIPSRSQNDVVKNEISNNTKVDSGALAVKENISANNLPNTIANKETNKDAFVKNNAPETSTINNSAPVKKSIANENASAVIKNNIAKDQADNSKKSPIQQPKEFETKELVGEKNTVKNEVLLTPKSTEQNTAIIKKDSSALTSANVATQKNDVAKTIAKKEEKVSEVKSIQKAPEQKTAITVAPKLPTITEQLASREIQNIQTVEFTSDSLRLELYDNGTIDGDSVSVIVNGRVVMEHQRLSGKAIPKTVYADGDSLKVVMFAENLGSIAPNTGLLIVYDGKKRYEITFSGDLKKNSAILFKRKRN